MKPSVIAWGVLATVTASGARAQTPPKPGTLEARPEAALAADVAPLRQTGDRALRTGDFDDAAKSYAIAALRAPNDPVLRLLTGVALTTIRRADTAAAQFKVACRLTDDDLLCSLLLQGALAQAGNTGEAQQVYADAVRRYAKPTGGLDSAASVTRLRAALAAAPDSPILHLLLGDMYQIAENLPEADAAYRKAIALAPGFAKPRTNLGLLKLAQNKPAEAARLFESALAHDPQNTELLFFRADAQRQSGDLTGAIATYRRIETRAVNRKTPAVAAQALTGLGQAYAAGGRIGDAVVALNRAKMIAPTDPAPPTALGEVQAKQKDYDAAAQNYTDALRLTKASGLFGAKTVLYQALAQTQFAGGDTKAALQTLTRAAVDEPANANVWNRLRGEMLLATGKQTEAEKAFRAAINAQTDAGTFPQETLALLAAKKLLGTIAAGYRADFGTSGAGFYNDATKPGIADVTGRVSGEPPTAETKIRAYAALAAIAQYEGDAAQETAHREAVCRLRGRGSDYYALADAYDSRARDFGRARDAYRKALNIGGLTDAQITRARLRAGQIGGATNP